MRKALRPGQVFSFGPDNSLAGVISAPGTPAGGVGMILWGLGVAEMRIARAQARRGIPAMQVRIDDGNHAKDFARRNAIYDRHGVAYCRAAMDYLAAEFHIRRFILMGNCATANLCFNAGIVDRRVVGLVLTNLHFSGLQTYGIALRNKLLQPKYWKKLLAGEMRLFRHLRALGTIVSVKLSGRRGKEEVAAVLAHSEHRGDVALPADLDTRLEEMSDRGVDTLIVCASAEDGLAYLRRTYQQTLDKLERRGSLWLKTLTNDVHVFSSDDVAAAALSTTIDQWVSTRFPQAGAGSSTAKFAPEAQSPLIALRDRSRVQTS